MALILHIFCCCHLFLGHCFNFWLLDLFLAFGLRIMNDELVYDNGYYVEIDMNCLELIAFGRAKAERHAIEVEKLNSNQ